MLGKAQRLAHPAAPLAACLQRISCTSSRTLTPFTEFHRNSIVWISRQKLVTATSLEGLKKITSDWSSTAVYSSTKPENLAKIDPVDFEIIDLTGIAKK